MTKQEALQLFASHVDVASLKSDFPDIDWIVNELSDGQQEIVIRLQGEDPDFRPAVDLAAIDEITMQDIPAEVKNAITLRKHKRKARRIRRARRDAAIFKRIDAMRIPMGITIRRCMRILRDKIEIQEDE
jgi:hypothetical protein